MKKRVVLSLIKRLIKGVDKFYGVHPSDTKIGYLHGLYTVENLIASGAYDTKNEEAFPFLLEGADDE